jgi:hypothetical protein
MRITVSFGKTEIVSYDGRVWFDHELRDAVVVGQIDEVNSAVVAAIPQPAGKPDDGIFPCCDSQFTACVTSILVQNCLALKSGVLRAHFSSEPWLPSEASLCGMPMSP